MVAVETGSVGRRVGSPNFESAIFIVGDQTLKLVLN